MPNRVSEWKNGWSERGQSGGPNSGQRFRKSPSKEPKRGSGGEKAISGRRTSKGKHSQVGSWAHHYAERLGPRKTWVSEVGEWVGEEPQVEGVAIRPGKDPLPHRHWREDVAEGELVTLGAGSRGRRLRGTVSFVKWQAW